MAVDKRGEAATPGRPAQPAAGFLAPRPQPGAGPGPGTVRLEPDPLLDSLLAYGTAGQVVAALDNASGDVEINDCLWAARALIGEGGRLQASPKKLDIVAAANRAQARMTVLE